MQIASLFLFPLYPFIHIIEDFCVLCLWLHRFIHIIEDFCVLCFWLLRLCEEGEILDSVENLMILFAALFFVIMALLTEGYYPPPGTGFPEPGYYAPPPPPQPYSQVEHHAHQPLSQEEDYRAHQGFGHVVRHESHRPFQRPEYDTPSNSFPRPRCGTSEGLIEMPIYGPRRTGYKPVLPRGQVVRVLTKANPDFWLTIRDDSIVLDHANPNDESQQWVMDETYNTKVKDEASYPSFSLVNKATGQALKHGLGETQPVLLKQYAPNKFDISILWTTSGDMGQGFRTIREVNNIHLNLDAFHGDKKSGGIKDGNPVVLWSWKKGDNQLWKIVPF